MLLTPLLHCTLFCGLIYHHVTRLANEAVQLDEAVRTSRLDSSSNYFISKLSPANKAKRHANLKKDKAHYQKLAKDISQITGTYHSTPFFVIPILQGLIVFIDGQVLPLTITKTMSCQNSLMPLKALILGKLYYKIFTKKLRTAGREKERC